MADEVHIQPTEAGEFELTRDGFDGRIVVSADHIVSLATALPQMARQILKKRHGSVLSKVLLEVSRVEVRSDLLASSVLLQLTDTQGNEYPFGISPSDALRLAQLLSEAVASAASPKTSQ